jgi:glycosyltransferase involved in cell wall biosynthesis
MKIVVITYNRPKELARILHELHGYDYHVVDDGSDVPPNVPADRLSRLPHFGKKGFWRTFNFAMAVLKASKHNDYLILSDDVCNIDFDRIKQYHQEQRLNKFFINAVNDGRDSCWNRPTFKARAFDGLIHTGFFDCGGLTNRRTLHDFYLSPVPDSWFSDEFRSSGVGAQITNRMNALNVPMYTPIKSLVYHGNHDSKMNPLERIRTKLQSK